MHPELHRRNQEIESIRLTPEEEQKAIWNYKVWKWNEERNRDYWESLEKQKPNEGKIIKADAQKV